jgi:hypothetical protein
VQLDLASVGKWRYGSVDIGHGKQCPNYQRICPQRASHYIRVIGDLSQYLYHEAKRSFRNAFSHGGAFADR